ncbi:MAG: hypothetical protein Q8904_08265 [Bacteroidota bacterium]|nr:hypothetical protein [Bacteroidota bacterium]
MLMFQNGLIASFIPELLMVIGYLFCLFTPGIKSQDSVAEQNPVVMQVSTTERQQVYAYQTAYSDFQTYAELVPDVKQSVSIFVKKTIPLTYESTFSTSDGLSYVDFSRPPPLFFL